MAEIVTIGSAPVLAGHAITRPAKAECGRVLGHAWRSGTDPAPGLTTAGRAITMVGPATGNAACHGGSRPLRPAKAVR